MYLVDTDWVIPYLKGRPEAVQLLAALSADGLAISIITHGEIYEGIYYGRDPKAAAAGFREFQRDVRVLPLTRRITQRYGHIRGDLRQRGLLIGDADLLIAATALHHDLTLVTRNMQHFGRIPGLHLYPLQ